MVGPPALPTLTSLVDVSQQDYVVSAVCFDYPEGNRTTVMCLDKMEENLILALG